MIPSSPMPAGIEPAAVLSDEHLLAATLEQREQEVPSSGSNRSLLVTAVLFLGFGGYYWGVEWVLILAVTIFLHELGHVAAMRVFGYKNVRILFIPLFGGLASGRPKELDGTKNALIALAGPAFGILTASVAGATAYMTGPQPWLVNFAWGALIVNALNLVPLVPLDGGRVVNAALFARVPVLELIFRLVAAALLGWWAWTVQSVFIGIIVVFLLLTTPPAFRRARALCTARRDGRWKKRELDLESIGALREVATTAYSKMPANVFNKKLPELVHGIWMEIHKRFPGPVGTVLLIAGYLLLCASAPFVLRLFAVYLGRPDFQ